MSETNSAAVAGAIPLPVASRPQSRFGYTQTVNNLSSGGSFPVIPLPATGWIRYLDLTFVASYTTSASAAVVAGDAPFTLVPAIQISDATGQPIFQPISAYNIYLINKYLPAGNVNEGLNYVPSSPMHSGDYAFTATGTSGSATFRLRLEFEQDSRTGYGSIPSLDSNAALQLKIDYAAITAAFTGGTASAGSLTVTVDQHYWAPVGTSLGGAAVDNKPPGAGDYLETRYETQTVTAATENLVTFAARGGFIKGALIVSRAAGVRTAFTANSNVGFVLDNQPIDEGVRLEQYLAKVRRATGYHGSELTTSYAPVTAGTVSGLDRGVLPVLWGTLSGATVGNRDSWLNTRVGSQYQARITPGASATQLEVITQLMQVHDGSAFFARD